MGFIECPERKLWVGAAIPFLWSPYAFPCTTKTLHRSGRMNRLAERLSFFAKVVQRLRGSNLPSIPRPERFLVAFSLWPTRPVASSEIELKSLSNFRAIGQSSYFAKQDLLFLGVSSNIAGSLCGFGHDDTYRPGQRLALHSSPSGFLQPPAHLFLTVDVSLTRTNQEFARH
jgi:hypothetical protein